MAKNLTEIKSLARSHTESALNVLAGIMNEPSAPHAARVSAANSLLDRGWGKPTQPVGGDKDHPLSFTVLSGVPRPEDNAASDVKLRDDVELPWGSVDN